MKCPSLQFVWLATWGILLQTTFAQVVDGELCTLENVRQWFAHMPGEQELAFTHSWPGREAKFPPKHYYFVAYGGNHLLVKSTNAIAFDSQMSSNALPAECTLLGKNGNVFWTLDERNGTSQMLVWTNRLQSGEMNNQVAIAHRSSVQSLDLLRGLGIQNMPINKLQWQGITFNYQAETNGAYFHAEGHVNSQADGSIRSLHYSYERVNVAGEAPKKLAFDVRFTGTASSSGYRLPQKFSVWTTPKNGTEYEVYRMSIDHFDLGRRPASNALFDFVTYISPDKTQMFFVSGTNVLMQSKSGMLSTVFSDPNDPRIVQQKRTVRSRSTYFLSAALLVIFPVTFMAIKLWNKRKTK